ncbi:MAG TPA: NAD(P)/FAD-dependent oxidoreductase [Gemmatimonadales bacterium]|nr:NAD(P)/FAD-dependent oxidoreductase [Gemmatimonadales bacterium]
MEPSHQFDLVVIGTGSAASTVADRCRSGGWSVAVVDSRPFGGTCALRGCDPKKVLVAAAEAVDWARRMRGKGIDPGGIRIDWRGLMRFKRTFTEPVPAARERSFADAGIAAFHGRARFENESTVRVGDARLVGKHIVIASGAQPAPLAFPGAERLVTSEQFLELNALPPRIVFVGGGYISCEFAHVARRAGAQVTIVHRGERLLEGFDPDLVARLDHRSRKLGIDIRLRREVQAVERIGDHSVVRASGPDADESVEADLVVHGAGRVAEIDDLDLAAGRVERGSRGVKVDAWLRSVSNPRVYAAGDSAETDGLPLTPVAGLEGRVVAANLLAGASRVPDYTGIPSVVFTLPPLARVGLSEAAARARQLRFRIVHEDTSGWYSSRRRGEEHSAFKVLIDEDTDRILGAHLLGPHAEETINVFGLAIRHGLTATQLKESVYAYPTHASDILYMV